MLKNNVRVWRLSSSNGVVEVNITDTSSLDEITRKLPQGFYSTFRTFDGGKRVLGLRAHLQRLYQPAAQARIKPAIPINTLRQTLSALLTREYPGEARVRTIMARSGKVYLAIMPLAQLPPEIYRHGVKVITTNMRRESPRLKSTAFISASQNTRNEIAVNDVFEALLVRNGFILEGMTSNFLYVKGGNLGTARQNILLGVTRRTVLRVAKRSGIKIIYMALKLERVSGLDEAFITSSTRGIVPVVQIDDIRVGEGRPGLTTKILSAAYDEYVIRQAEPIY